MKKHTYLEEKNETMGENSFMKKLLKKRLNQKGLTLIELLAVIVILAIIAAIAIPAISGIIASSRDRATLSDASSVLSGAKLAVTANSCGDAVTTGTTAAPIVTITCSQDQLESYVDNIDETLSDGTTAVTYTAVSVNGDWTVNYNALTEISADDYPLATDGNLTEEELLNYMD